jgi:FAD/FMN-containing dehydrogenase
MSVLDRLKDAVGAKGFSTDPAEIAPHLEEWRGKYHGHSPILLKPDSAAQVSAALRICHETGTQIVPQGGNTGLVGGQIPFNGEVLLSTKRLNKVRSIDESGMTMTVEAGVTLAEVQYQTAERHLLFPLSLASEGSCSIGGNIATNAGGTHVLRYGMTRALVLGLEVVLPDGTVLDMLRALAKDNSGYDLKQVFIGSEGTLGVITAATLKLFAKPDASVTALAAVPSPAAAVTLLGAMQGQTGGMLSAFELLPRIALDFVIKHIDGTRDPLNASSPWYVLIEATGGRHANLEASGDRRSGGLQRHPGRRAVEAARKHLRGAEARRRLHQARHRRAGGGNPGLFGQGNAGGARHRARGTPGQLRPSGRRQYPFQFQFARSGQRSGLPGAVGRRATGGARHRQGIRRLDQCRAWHRGDESRQPAPLQEP